MLIVTVAADSTGGPFFEKGSHATTTNNTWGHELGMMGNGDGDRAAAAAVCFVVEVDREIFEF
jgi:hypothetical protein